MPVSFFQNNPPEVYHVRLESHPYYFDENGEKIILFPVEELKLPARYANPWGFRKRKVLVYKTGEDIIWGMTANLIYEFVNNIKSIIMKKISIENIHFSSYQKFRECQCCFN